MKINHTLFIALIALCFTTPTFAMFCPTNFNEIKIGDTRETVELRCGKPNAVKTYQSQPEQDYFPQEWSFLVRPNPISQNGMRVNFIFQDKKAVSISVNGFGMSQTQICGSLIQVGDSMEKIKKACGSPIFVNRSSDAEETMSKSAQHKTTSHEMTEITYTNIPKPMTLIFENGVFKGTK